MNPRSEKRIIKEIKKLVAAGYKVSRDGDEITITKGDHSLTLDLKGGSYPFKGPRVITDLYDSCLEDQLWSPMYQLQRIFDEYVETITTGPTDSYDIVVWCKEKEMAYWYMKKSADL